MELMIKLEDPDLMPVRAHPTDAGLDLKADDEYILQLNERVLVGTGVSVKIPVNHVGLLFPRSSLSKRGITMTNSVGVIDSDYRGEILASLVFNGVRGNCNETTILRGERIVQLVIVPIVLATPVAKDYTDEEWYSTLRGTGGFGSTGK